MVNPKVQSALMFVQGFARSFANARLTDEDITALLDALGPNLKARIREVLLAKGSKP